MVGALSIIASLVGGFLIFGGIQLGLTGGLQGVIWGLSYIIGIPLIIRFIGQADTLRAPKGLLFGLDQIVMERYGRFSLFLFYLTLSILFIGVLAGQFLGLTFLFPALGDGVVVLWIMGLGVGGTILYTTLFGLRGVLANDILQAILIIFLGVFLPISAVQQVTGSGGAGNRLLEIGPVIESTVAVLPISLAGSFFLLLSFTVRADIWARLRLVAPEQRRSCAIASGIVIFLFYVSGSLTGWIIAQHVGVFGVEIATSPTEMVARLVQPRSSSSLFQKMLFALAIAGVLYVLFIFLWIITSPRTRLQTNRPLQATCRTAGAA